MPQRSAMGVTGICTTLLGSSSTRALIWRLLLTCFLAIFTFSSTASGAITTVSVRNSIDYFNSSACKGCVPSFVYPPNMNDGVFTQVDRLLKYTCTGSCRIFRWNVYSYGTCVFAMQIFRKVGIYTYKILGQNIFAPPEYRMRPHGTLYEYDVPVADQITFTGTVYFGFSQVRQFPILPKDSLWLECGFLRSGDPTVGFAYGPVQYRESRSEREYTFPCTNRNVTFSESTDEQYIFGADFIDDSSFRSVKPVYRSGLQCPNFSDIDFIAGPSTAPPSTLLPTTVSSPATLPPTTVSSPATLPPTTVSSPATLPPTTVSSPATLPLSAVSSSHSEQTSGSTVSLTLLAIVLPMSAVALAVLIAIMLVVRAVRAKRRRQAMAWQPACTPGGGNLSPMHRAAVIGNNRDGAMAMKNLPATSHVSFQCAHLQPYPSDGQMSEISPEGSIGTSVSVTSNVAYPSAVDSRCHTSDHDAAVRESMAERPALSLPSEASCSSQSSHDDSLEVFVSGARARTGPAISSFVAPKAPSQTHGDEYELVPVISTTIKALATTFTSSREMDSEGSNVASALSENPSPDSGSEMLYDVPLDAERWMKYKSRISSYSNHECCGQLGDQPAAAGAAGWNYRLPYDAVRVPGGAVYPSCSQLQSVTGMQRERCVTMPVGAQATRHMTEQGYLLPGDEDEAVITAVDMMVLGSNGVLPASYFDLDEEAHGQSQALELQATISERVKKIQEAVRESGDETQDSAVADVDDEDDDEEEDIFDRPFVPPPESVDDLQQQLTSQGIPQFDAAQLVVADVLGTGEFGVVRRGTLSQHNEVSDMPVAVKDLHDRLCDQTGMTVSFLKEALMLGQFRHQHVIELLGVVNAADKPLRLVLELLSGGDLLSHLHTMKSSDSLTGDALVSRLLQFSLDIARGAEYLAAKDFIHRDLAGRNIMLDGNLVCKISDFGLSRKLSECSFYQSRGGKVPVRWTSPEALIFHLYSVASDVWSYGIILYEIWSLGIKPYQYMSPAEIINALVMDNYRLPRPPSCPENIYRAMIACWLPRPQSRPSFKMLVKLLLAFGRRTKSLLRGDGGDKKGKQAVKARRRTVK